MARTRSGGGGARGPPEAGEEASGRSQKGTSGTALCQGPMRAMPVPNPYWSVSSEQIVPPKANASPMCWGGVGPVSAVLSTGNDTRQHIKMGHTLSRISTVAICI